MNIKEKYKYEKRVNMSGKKGREKKKNKVEEVGTKKREKLKKNQDIKNEKEEIKGNK